MIYYKQNCIIQFHKSNRGLKCEFFFLIIILNKNKNVICVNVIKCIVP